MVETSTTVEETTTAAAGPEEEVEGAAPEQTLLNNLRILPPRQKNGNVNAVGLKLPSIRAEEPVHSLRHALSEVLGYAHITNFRFELEANPTATTAGAAAVDDDAKTSIPLISPFTGTDAVVSIPIQLKSLNDADGEEGPAAAPVLDDYGDLTSMLTHGLQDASAFCMVLERYDISSIKDHVQRLQSLFDGNAPHVVSLVEEKAEELQTEEGAGGSEEEGGEEEKEGKKSLPPLVDYSNATPLDGKNLRDFYYLACGEDPTLCKEGSTSRDEKPKKKKKGKAGDSDDSDKKVTAEQLFREKIPLLNELDEKTRLSWSIQFSGFHPPPSQRRLMGDLAYLEVSNGETTIHVTAVATGFYVNRSSSTKSVGFDPSPAAEPCFSHTLLDCLLQSSTALRNDWEQALIASKERASIINELNKESINPLFRLAIRGDFTGFKTSVCSYALSTNALDASMMTPSWLTFFPTTFGDTWNRNAFHSYNRNRAIADISNTHGVDIRTGAIRDWNEELQLAREMPSTTFPERLERARLIHKVMTEFGEAALVGVKAVSEGQVAPMNPNEPIRSQVYLHNNIFFSRAVDAGPETFKLAKGDRAARKSANRDIQCISIFHRMDKCGFYTLATVLVDYIGTRYVCQSILPGILIGEKSHTLLYGAVEAGSPLKWDKELHETLESKLGEAMMIASRPILKSPLNEDRLEEIKQLKAATPALVGVVKEESKEEVKTDETITSCIPIEAKGILGSDQRRYMLDFGRLTPRDANWLSKENGGTGRFEQLGNENGKSGTAIPLSLEDDEWTMSVLRPELITRFTQVKMAKFIQQRRQKEAEKKSLEESDKTEKKESPESSETNDAIANETSTNDTAEQNNPVEAKEESNDEKQKEEDQDASRLSDEDLTYLKSIRMNVNVFLPDIRSFAGISEEAAELVKKDEDLAREAAQFLWDDVLPRITKAVKEGSVHQVPVDGKTLTEFVHRFGVNCRYLGRLAMLAKEQEEKDTRIENDLRHGRLPVVERRTLPKCWLELLECEMVARAAKHVLDSYLTEHGGVAAAQPAQTIASFLSALVSEGEETAAETEKRLEKSGAAHPDEDDFRSLTIGETGGDGDAIPCPPRGRVEVWQDIALEVGRRFRYTLTLYNTGTKNGRARYIPLLRRVCQRTGIRIAAKNYDVGGKCLCSSGNAFGGSLSASYPISPVDIVDIVPLMKHVAAYGEGFTPCSLSPAISLPALQVSLPDARLALERAHLQVQGHGLAKGLELAQEAAAFYQRVTENQTHPGVIESVELMAAIFLEAGDAALAVANGDKALNLTIQSSGFDSASTFNAHMTMFQMAFAAREMDRAVKHLRAGIYLLDLMAGPSHLDHFTAYHKLGSTYSHSDYDGKYLSMALKYFEEASRRDSCDRLMNGITAKNYAKTLADLGQYKEALENEKKAYLTLSMFLGKDHKLTKDCDADLQKYTKLAVEKGSKIAESQAMLEEAAKAEAIAADLVADEEREKKKVIKKKKGKK